MKFRFLISTSFKLILLAGIALFVHNELFAKNSFNEVFIEERSQEEENSEVESREIKSSKFVDVENNGGGSAILPLDFQYISQAHFQFCKNKTNPNNLKLGKSVAFFLLYCSLKIHCC